MRFFSTRLLFLGRTAFGPGLCPKDKFCLREKTGGRGPAPKNW